METINTLFQVAQMLLALVTLLMIFVKPFRKWFFKIQDRKKSEKEDDAKRDEAIRCTLRNIITQFYYQHLFSCEMHQYEYENISKVYESYKQMGGNSFVDKIWEEIQTWAIVP